MKIAQSQVALSSPHEAARQTRVDERLRLWRGNRSLEVERKSSTAMQVVGQSVQQAAGAAPSAWLHLSPLARQVQPADALRQTGEYPRVAVRRSDPPTKPLASEDMTPGSEPAEALATRGVDERSNLEPRLQMVVRMVEALTGERVRIVSAADFEPDSTPADLELTDPAPAEQTRRASATTTTAEGWGLSYDRTDVQYEHEATTLTAQGQVQTADGVSVAFELHLEMQREFISTSQASVRAGDAVLKDPLVLQFDGPAAALTDTRFAFDLDADGQTETMPFAGSGSGFLVLDRNANGQIDDGRELFGALSGDGFADLAALDMDRNGWIDETDTAFAQLQVWQKDEQGQDQLRSLAQAGVGALYLGRVASPFSVRSAANATLGEVRSSGLYLTEEGQAKAMQQIDLSV